MDAVSKGTTPWNSMNALGVLILIVICFMTKNTVSYGSASIQQVKDNWAYHRCQPSIMPFASMYGHNTAENFEFCMKSMFMSHASDITGPFTEIQGFFAEVLGDITYAMNSIREGISTMGGGINVIFQDFTDRIAAFFFQLRMSAIRIKTLMGRMYALMFSVLYMGMSSMEAGTNFSNTALFGFMDTFCFVPETMIDVEGKGLVPIHEIRIGDVLLPTRGRVTSKFLFSAQGQPMVQLGEITVSTNHYLFCAEKGEWIQAVQHFDAVPLGPYDRHSLVCLNTHDHMIPIGPYLFRDYDETDVAHGPTMRMIEGRINGRPASNHPYSFRENSPSLHPDTLIRRHDNVVLPVRDIRIGDVLSTGSTVVGLLHKEVSEVCQIGESLVGSATLVWRTAQQQWRRVGEFAPVQTIPAHVFLSLIVVPNSQIELADHTFIRDYLELCSPDAEEFYKGEVREWEMPHQPLKQGADPMLSGPSS